MKKGNNQNLKRITAVGAILALYWFARLPTLADGERADLASHFTFERTPLPEIPNVEKKTIRTVHRDMNRLAAWISSLGAAVAINDLDNDGLENDLCHVDPRTDMAVVSPVPNTGDRFKPFELKPESLPYDANTMAPMGCLPGDINEDGLLDIIVYYWGRTPVAFIRNTPIPAPLVRESLLAPNTSGIPSAVPGEPLSSDSFTAIEIAPKQERWFTNAAAFTDLDGDTHADLIFCNYFPDGADILNANSTEPQHMQDSMSRAYNGGEKHIFLWNAPSNYAISTAPFTEVHNLFDDQLNHGWALGIGAADLNGDALPELYFANDFGPDRLMHNRSTPGKLAFSRLDGVKTFTTPNSKVLGRDSYKGMSVDFGDINGDGLLDIFVSNIAEEFALEESHFAYVSTGQTAQMKAGIAPYRDESESLGLSRSGWGWETRFGDFDNDGTLEALQATGFIRGEKNRWPELHELAMGNDFMVHLPGAWANYKPGDEMSGHGHNPFYAKAADGRFYDLAADIGLGDTQISRGISTADVDGDGDLDFAIANQWEPSYFFRNDSKNKHASLSLSLRFRNDISPSPKRQRGMNSPESKDTAPIGVSNGWHGQPRVTLARHTQLNPNETADDDNNANRLPVRAREDASQLHATTRAAIGATAIITLPSSKKIVSYVDGGNGHSGKRGHEVHFGLGNIAPTAKINVEIRWRNGDKVESQRFDLTPGRHTLILENQSAIARGENA